MSNIKAFGTHTADKDLEGIEIKRREVLEKDVELEILYCGVCHSDLHMARNDWGNSIYPLIPGHEIVGRVTSVGEKVTKFKPGDLAAVGVLVDSCRECDSCKRDLEQYCLSGPTGTYNAPDIHLGGQTYGGYSKSIVTDEHFVFSIPENLDLAGIAPILCAGITTWSPLKHWNIGEGSKVAVAGLGGLGHMALKLAKALGAHVTLLSRSPDKIEDAKKLGADEVIITTDEEQMNAIKNKFELIVDTIPYDHDLNPYMKTLKVDGTLALVGLIGEHDYSLNTRPFIGGRRSVAGSMIGGMAETQELLDFCGKHNITADVEVINMDEINQAYERMLKSDVKYRFVVDMASL